MRLRLPRTTTYDLTLLVVVLALTLLGIAMVFSASGMRALDTLDDPRYYLSWQALWAAIGLAGMFAALVVAEPDLGTAIVLVAIAMTMYFVAGARLRVFAALGALVSVAVAAVAV